MTSGTVIPEERPVANPSENDPLLAHSEDVGQDEKNVWFNLIADSAGLAQIGIWVLAALVWSKILAQPIILFTAHPLLASSALLLQIQGILILQPTTTATPSQKRTGSHIHYTIQLISTTLFLAAFIIIEINKGSHAHFTSAHSILGLLTVIFVVCQSLFGVVQYFLPELVLGSVDNGKKLYKYHRWSGYVALLVLEIPAAIWGATQTDYSIGFLHIPLWAVLAASAAVIIGLGARIKKQKLGLGN
ncbi:Cytochrome b561 eukaryote [Penicillium longicatenatum]|uniref:Cytochrome b561 eukaryote n=1 Tax=Penicillium longicatenatum TaxID=1561947 RepID=UPI0025498537|nr:Cytochrome b561 eukaryote [Penicillium longicatenatum]KAJ5643961.1 Cytochrome b561 eukaryote [Penicillium longicatenatum]